MYVCTRMTATSQMAKENEELKTQAKEFHRACSMRQSRIDELTANLGINADQMQSQARHVMMPCDDAM